MGEVLRWCGRKEREKNREKGRAVLRTEGKVRTVGRKSVDADHPIFFYCDQIGMIQGECNGW